MLCLVLFAGGEELSADMMGTAVKIRLCGAEGRRVRVVRGKRRRAYKWDVESSSMLKSISAGARRRMSAGARRRTSALARRRNAAQHKTRKTSGDERHT